MAESRSIAAKKLYLVAELVDLDAEAVKLDLVLPVVTGWHSLGGDRATGLDELQEHAQLFYGGPGISPLGIDPPMLSRHGIEWRRYRDLDR